MLYRKITKNSIELQGLIDNDAIELVAGSTEFND